MKDRVEAEAGGEAWRRNHGISSSSRRSAGHPRESAKEGFAWHSSKEVESGFRLCLRQRLGRACQKQMGHRSQSLCSPFLCQVTIEEKHCLLPGRVLRQPGLCC